MKYKVVAKRYVDGIVYEHYEVNATNEEEARQKVSNLDGELIYESQIEVIGYHDFRVVETKKIK